MDANWHRRPGRAALLVAHRGASDVAPENTLPAIERAIETGADAIEIDVQRTADGVPILVHDDSWKRTAGVDVDVRALTWEQARALDAGAWFGDSFRGVRPARLDEVLEVVKGRAALDIEIKSPGRDPDLAGAVVDCVRAHGVQRSVLLTSFDHACIDALAGVVDDIPLGYIAVQMLAPRAQRVRVFAYEARLLLAQPQVVEETRRRGDSVLAWTVDGESEAKALLDAGVDALVTNRPQLMAPILRSRS